MSFDRTLFPNFLPWLIAILLISPFPVSGEVFEVKQLSMKRPGVDNNYTESTWIGTIGSGADGVTVHCTVTLKHSELSDGIIKYTWSINVQNHSDTPLTLSLTLILTDDRKEVLHASTIDRADVPAKGTGGFFQSEPVRDSEWEKVFDHEISIVLE
jgi:hypothetical protein